MNTFFEFDPAPFRRLLSAAEQSVAASSGPMRDAFVQAGALYLNYTRRRFLNNARGGGDWPDLALSTKVSRSRKTKAGKAKYNRVRKVVKKGKHGRIRDRVIGTMQLSGSRFEILRDTGILFNSLSTGAPNAVMLPLPDGIRVGTAVKYAEFHQNPSKPGRPPKREIFVAPDEATAKRIGDLIARAAIQAIQQMKGA